jgi:hypothetical protein
VFLSILGISWFWLYGALFLAQFPAYAKNVLGGGEVDGDAAARHFHGRYRPRFAALRADVGKHVEIGLVPFGSIGLTLFGIDLYFASPVGLVGTTARTNLLALLSIPAIWRVLFDLMMLGVFRRLLHRAALRAGADAQRAGTTRADHCRQQHSQRAVHGRRRAGGGQLLGAGLSIPALFGLAAL